jgi:hypothetical protein
MILQNVNNRETLESRSRPGTQGRGVRGGQGNFSPHRIVHGKISILNNYLFEFSFHLWFSLCCLYSNFSAKTVFALVMLGSLYLKMFRIVDKYEHNAFHLESC